jgi:hypothetical protein
MKFQQIAEGTLYGLAYYCKTLLWLRETGNDTVEGILYSQDTAVIMTGKFVDEQDVDKNKINRYPMVHEPMCKKTKLKSIFFFLDIIKCCRSFLIF